MTPIKHELLKAVQHVVELLVDRRYEDLALETGNIRLPKDQIEFGIKRYGRTLVLPPDGFYRYLTVGQIHCSVPPSWWAVMPLCTKEEGRSDLSIELTLVEEPTGVRVELDDIRVM